MRKDKKPEFDRSDLGVNPFLMNLKIRVNKIEKGNQFSKDKDGVWMPVEIELEADKSTRVYVDALKREIAVNLPKGGTKLLIWLLYEIESLHDYVWINKLRYMREAGISSVNTYKQSVVDLQKAGFIMPTTEGDVYWINPALFFQGSRITAFPGNIIRK